MQSKVRISNCDLCSCTLQNEDWNGYIDIHHMIKRLNTIIFKYVKYRLNKKLIFHISEINFNITMIKLIVVNLNFGGQ